MMEKTDGVRMHGAPHATAPPAPRCPPRLSPTEAAASRGLATGAGSH